MILSMIAVLAGALTYVKGYHAIGSVMMIVGAYCLGFCEGATNVGRRE